MRVDPDRLLSAARAQTEVGAAVSGMAAAQPIVTAGAAMAGLASEAACQFAGSLFDTATSTVHTELTEHASKLSEAAAQYQRADEELGSRIRKVAR